jgi:hypothetical protein
LGLGLDLATGLSLKHTISSRCLSQFSLLNIDDDHNFFIGKRFNTSEGSHPVILHKCYKLFAAYDIAKAASFTFIASSG